RIEADQNTSLNDECRYTRRPLAGHARVPNQILQRLRIIVDRAHHHLQIRPLARDCRQIFFRGGAMRTILANENFEHSLTRRRALRESTCSEKNQRNEQPHQMRLLKAWEAACHKPFFSNQTNATSVTNPNTTATSHGETPSRSGSPILPKSCQASTVCLSQG